MAALRGTGWGNGEQRPVVKATIQEGGVLYTNVAVHLKGAAGSFRSVDDDPCFTLNFEKFASGQSFHGLHKLSLNNSVQDPSYMTEKICRELFEAAGVPAPRAGYAKLQLNGRDLGLRVLVEGWSKQFLKRYFKDTRGNLYDGGFLQDITDSLEVNSGDDPKDHSDLRALASACRENDPAKRFSRLEQVLDMDRFLSFVAIDIMECDWDGYPMNRNNWRLFHDLGSNKMVFLPHGLDQMFGVERTTPECPIIPYLHGMVARAVIDTTEGKRRYLARMTELYTNVFRVDAILRRVDELTAVIRPVIAESGNQDARNHDQSVQWLKERIKMRDESLRRQLRAVTPAVFDADGTLHLAGWRQRRVAGVPEFQDKQANTNKAVLYIGALHGEIVGAWTTRVRLESGSYRFVGMVRTRNVDKRTGEAEGGAGLHTSGGSVPPGVLGNVDWREFVYPFRVSDDGEEEELVCELRASQGECWFEPTTLRLVKGP
jgi:hypothetical protein